MCRNLAVSFLVAVVTTGAPSGQAGPDFSGSWVLASSSSPNAVTGRLTLTIEQTSTSITITDRVVGLPDTSSPEVCWLEGAEAVPATAECSFRWVGENLVVTSRRSSAQVTSLFALEGSDIRHTRMAVTAGSPEAEVVSQVFRKLDVPLGAEVGDGTKEIYDIAMTEALGARRRDVVVADSPVAGAEWDPEFGRRALPEAPEDLLERAVLLFLDTDSAPFRPDQFPPATRFLPRARILQAFDDARKQGADLREQWTRVRQWLGASAWVEFSRVAVTDEGNDALLYYAYHCGSLCGEGVYLWLHRDTEDARWVIAGRVPRWVS